MLGRLLDNLPARTCPDCNGTGQVPGYRVGSALAFVKCQRSGCSHGRIKADLQDDRPGHLVPCPHCIRDERSTGEIDGRTCFHCRGSGTVMTRGVCRINNALIQGTKASARAGAGVVIGDELEHRIDLVICHDMPERLSEVIVAAYYYPAIPNWRHAKRLHLTPMQFSRIRARAETYIAERIDSVL